MCLILVLHEEIYASPNLFPNGQIKHNKWYGKSLTFYLFYLTQCNNSFEKTVKTRMIGPNGRNATVISRSC